MDRADAAVIRQALVDAGHEDLNSDRLALAFSWFAEALRTSTLDSFDDANDRIGTENGLASGFVRRALDELTQLGYLAVEPSGTIRLTAKGSGAASVTTATKEQR